MIMKNKQYAKRPAKRPRHVGAGDFWSAAVETRKLPPFNTLYPVCHSGGKSAARGVQSCET